jgi:hypothetical protein
MHVQTDARQRQSERKGGIGMTPTRQTTETKKHSLASSDEKHKTAQAALGRTTGVYNNDTATASRAALRVVRRGFKQQCITATAVELRPPPPAAAARI